MRIFHWSLATAFAVSYFWDDDMSTHENAGYVVLVLVALRLPWGLWGPPLERFRDFVHGPSVVFRYLRGLVTGAPNAHIGHNPAGGWMIVALLLTLLVLTISGVVMTTDAYWGNALVEDIHYLSADIAVGLILFHVLGGIASSLLYRENLILAMITGRKRPRP